MRNEMIWKPDKHFEESSERARLGRVVREGLSEEVTLEPSFEECEGERKGHGEFSRLREWLHEGGTWFLLEELTRILVAGATTSVPYPRTHPSMHNHASIHLFTYACTHPCTWTSVHLSIHLCAHPCLHPSVHLSTHAPIRLCTDPLTHAPIHTCIYVLITPSMHLTDIHWQPTVCQTHLFSLTWSPSSINNWPLFPFGNFPFSRLPRKHALLVLLPPYLAPAANSSRRWMDSSSRTPNCSFTRYFFFFLVKGGTIFLVV